MTRNDDARNHVAMPTAVDSFSGVTNLSPKSSRVDDEDIVIHSA